MKTQFLSSSFLAAFLTTAFSVQATSAWAESSATWGEQTETVAASKDLRWAKPKVAKMNPKFSSGVVTAGYVEVESTIEQVQFAPTTTPPPLPPPRTLTSEQDMVFPEKRPQINTPPTGATSTPLTPSNPPSSFTAPKIPTPTPPAATPPAPTTTSAPAAKPAPAPAPTAPAPAPAAVKPAPAPEKPSTVQSPLSVLNTDDPVLKGKLPAPKPLVNAPPTVKPAPLVQSSSREINCPQTAGFKSIKEISYDIRPMPGELPKECPLVTTPYAGRHFGMTCFQWKASALCTKGAATYFEDVQLERYGHTICPCLEPFISGGKFFLTIPLLPYYMGVTPPCECVYTLGYYRVGSCAPYMLDPFPISVRAMLFEAAAIGGAIAIIP